MKFRLSQNHDARPANLIDTLVLHYTGMKTATEAIERLCDPAAEVSAHYVVEEDGTIWSLVPEELRAWHAGQSYWRGRTGLNDVSIGIEIINPGHEWGYRDFPPSQMESVIKLCQGIVRRHPIPPFNVVAHSDIAPRRKLDPGERFSWSSLAQSGIGLWPGHGSAPALDWQDTLAMIGYETDDPRASLLAFQRHWSPDTLTGRADQACLMRLRDVAASFLSAGLPSR